MEDCIFCKIIAGDIPSDILYRDNEVIAFRDVNPVAPTHILIVPVDHLVTTQDIPEDNTSLTCKMIQTANRLAKSFQEKFDSTYKGNLEAMKLKNEGPKPI